jgi:hypothetical protein
MTVHRMAFEARASDAACGAWRTTVMPPAGASDRARNRLLICPCCSSASIYPIDLAGWARAAIVSRRCPVCEHRDVVAVSRLAAFDWFERIAREREELAALCDAIGDGLPLEPSSW